MKEFTHQEQSQLLYLETCVVDQCGKVQQIKMNSEDFELSKLWNDNGLIEFGRLPAHYITETQKDKQYPFTHYVKFTDKAWKLSAKYRKVRAERNASVLEKIFTDYPKD